jgi:serine/threonine protein kinase
MQRALLCPGLAAAVPGVVALHVARRAGVTHRDLKPTAILLDDDGNAPWPTSAATGDTVQD